MGFTADLQCHITRGWTSTWTCCKKGCR
jgi:hypothetical protein